MVADAPSEARSEALRPAIVKSRSPTDRAVAISRKPMTNTGTLRLTGCRGPAAMPPATTRLTAMSARREEQIPGELGDDRCVTGERIERVPGGNHLGGVVNRRARPQPEGRAGRPDERSDDRVRNDPESRSR
jgi:hypothetical protein